MSHPVSTSGSPATIRLSAIMLMSLVSASPIFAAPPTDAKPAVTTPTKTMSAAAKPAKPHYATSTVKDYVVATRRLTLVTGKIYILDAAVKDDGLKTGQKVKVRYVMRGTERHADRVTFVRR